MTAETPKRKQRAPRTDPRIIRDALNHIEAHGTTSAEREFGIHHATFYPWIERRRESGGVWPTQDDIDTWIARAPQRAADAARKRRYNARRHFTRRPVLLDSIGTVRRLQALGAVGHSTRKIGEELGLTAERVAQLARGRHRRVRPETAAAVAALYRRWCMVVPTGKSADMTRHYAQRAGWVTALAWEDGAIDDPAARPSEVLQGDGEVAA